MKIEFDLPEFEKEIKVEIIIRKDGEVVYTSSSTPNSKLGSIELPNEKPVELPKKQSKNIGGNLMGMEF